MRKEQQKKKIVALALCLVLALSLCATAFAKTTSTGKVETSTLTLKDAELFSLNPKTSVSDDIDTVKVTVTTGKIVDDVNYYVPNVYEITITGSSAAEYVEVSKDAATHSLVNNGKTVYLAMATTALKTGTSIVVDKKVEKGDNCGDYTADVYLSGTNTYATAGSDLGYMNGSFVLLDKSSKNATTTVAHKFEKKNVTFDAKGEPVSVKCSNCPLTFKVVKTADLDKDLATGDYESDSITGLAAGYSVVLKNPGSTTGTTSGSKVDSAKTFDAGIALYVGMSISAVAGSAVVIGKKKEF